jgi:ABC-2 type transport system ATP-binding protein
LTGRISLEQVAKSYGDRSVLRDLSLNVARGEIVGLLGPNGAGKTTAQRLMFGLAPRDAGRIAIDDLDPMRSAAAVKRIAGYSPEEPSFFDYLTAAETLDFAADVRGLGREDARKGLQPAIDALGFAESLAAPAGTLSHGAKKKLALLVALQHQPGVLLLDEPANGLDPIAADQLRMLLRDRAERGAAILVSTHLLTSAEVLCDRLVLLHQGRVTAQGSAVDLREQAQAPAGTPLERVFVGLIHGQ